MGRERIRKGELGVAQINALSITPAVGLPSPERQAADRFAEPGRVPVPHSLLALTLLAMLVAPAWGQQALRLPRLEGPSGVDGRVDEPAWESVPILPLTQFTGVPG